MGKVNNAESWGGKGHGEEEPHGVPLPVPLLLEDDISEAAGAPEEVEEKRKAVGSQGRRHRGLGTATWGQATQE